MRSRIAPAVLAMAIAASGPTPLDHGILTPAQVDGEPPRKKQRKPRLSDKEPRRHRGSGARRPRTPNAERQQAAAEKRARRALKRVADAKRQIEGAQFAAEELQDEHARKRRAHEWRQRRDALWGRHV